MHRRIDIRTVGILLALLFGILAPNSAAAFGACTDSERAADDPFASIGFFETDEPTMMSLKVESRQPDCSTVDEDSEADPAFAACYDSVDLPISTLPSLFAQHQADAASNGILGKVGELLGHVVESPSVEPNPAQASVELSPADRVRQAWRSSAQSVPRHEASCTMSTPDSCRSAPAVPSFWIPEVTASSASQTLWELEIEPLAQLDRDSGAPAHLARMIWRSSDVPVPPPRA